jgi:hypothetical protein
MSQRHTLLFGTVLVVAGAGIAADHLTHRPTLQAAPSPVTAPAVSPQVIPQSTPTPDDSVIELSPCSAGMDGLMAPSPPKPAPKPVMPATETIIELSPCSAAF